MRSAAAVPVSVSCPSVPTMTIAGDPARRGVRNTTQLQLAGVPRLVRAGVEPASLNKTPNSPRNLPGGAALAVRYDERRRGRRGHGRAQGGDEARVRRRRCARPGRRPGAGSRQEDGGPGGDRAARRLAGRAQGRAPGPAEAAQGDDRHRLRRRRAPRAAAREDRRRAHPPRGAGGEHPLSGARATADPDRVGVALPGPRRDEVAAARAEGAGPRGSRSGSARPRPSAS